MLTNYVYNLWTWYELIRKGKCTGVEKFLERLRETHFFDNLHLHSIESSMDSFISSIKGI